MLIFNDIDLEEIVKVVSIETTLMSNRENFNIDVSSRNGKLYNGFRYNEKIIIVKCDIKKNSDQEYLIVRDELSNALNVEEPKQLFKDGNGRFFFAIPEGEISEEKICDGFYSVSITFVCYDPHAYSEEAKQYDTEDGSNNITCTNEGSVEACPIIDIGITKDAHFVQVENLNSNKKILVGSYPSNSTTVIKEKTTVLSDNCEQTTDWIVGSTNIDSGRSANGTLGVTSSGQGIMAADYGSKSTGATWFGTCARKNLNTQVKDFYVECNMSHNSTGVNGDPTQVPEDKETSTSGSKKTYYKVTCSSLNVRSGPGTKYRRVGSLKKNTKVIPSSISKGWAKITYKSKVAYVSTSYLKKYISDTRVTISKKNFVTKQNTAIRSTYKLSATNKCTIPNGTVVRCIYSKKYLDPTDKNKKRYYYKLATKYKGHTGYVCVDNLIQASDAVIDYPEDLDVADDKTGIVEVYGYTANNEKLFRLGLYDDNQYYEFTYPLIQVGSSDFLKEKTVAPKPKQKTTTSGSDDKLTVSKDYLLSGRYADWNEFWGKLGIQRKDGKWKAWVYKITDGKTVKKILKNETKVSGSPVGDLAYIVVYFGTSNSVEKASGVALTHVTVKNLNPKSYEVGKNVTIFEEGDTVKVDCYNNRVYVNDKPYSNVDIGSQFFELEPGESTIKINSDDTDISASVIFNERWL